MGTSEQIGSAGSELRPNRMSEWQAGIWGPDPGCSQPMLLTALLCGEGPCQLTVLAERQSHRGYVSPGFLSLHKPSPNPKARGQKTQFVVLLVYVPGGSRTLQPVSDEG